MNSPIAWALVFHVLGFVFWLAGLLVGTQVLAAQIREPSDAAREALGRLEMKLLNGVANPGAAITIVAGIVLVSIQREFLRQTWLHAKLALVSILIALHVAMYVRARAFQAGRLELKRWESKALHGVISLVFLGILILVLIKPF